jgi:NADPH-ferrihemoprotein reductase
VLLLLLLCAVLHKASGRNVLYFGSRSRSKDYLYGQQLDEWAANKSVDLRLAFSRDQKDKVYVQHLIQQDANKVWDIIKVRTRHARPSSLSAGALVS